METEQRLYKIALGLSVFTIAANLIEGAASTILGYADETLALMGFGIDSFIEVISAVGITWMILRIRNEPDSPRSVFEVRALKVTGTSFYILTAGLLVTAVLNIFNQTKPSSTFWGTVISLISLSIMIWLMRQKQNVGRSLHSEAILADANCTKTCIYMSGVLLVSSLLYTVTHIPFLDALGAAGLAYFSFTEGRESFEKAAGKECDDCPELA